MDPPRMDAIVAVLRGSRLFGSLEHTFQEEAARAARRVRFRRGEFLWRAGQSPLSVTLIASGLVKVCQPWPAGCSTILGIFGPRESIGDVAVTAGIAYPANAIAATDVVEVVAVDRALVLDAMGRRPELAVAMNRSLAEHTMALRGKIEILSAGPVDARLVTLLCFLAARFGDDLDDGTVCIPVALSRTELASMVSATVETTIRVMSRWQKAGLIATTSEGFVVPDLERLRRVAGAPSPVS